MVFAAAIMQLRVLDHIIIGNNRYFSFTGEELIGKYELEFLNLKIRRVPGSGQAGISATGLPWTALID